MCEEPPEYSEEQKNFLSTDEFISAVLKKRNSDGPPSRLRIFLESAGGAAIITVIIGAIATHLITNSFQLRQAERDFANRVIESFSANKVALLNKAIEDRSLTLNDSLKAVGNVISKAESRIDIDGPAFAVRVDDAAETVNKAQKIEIRREFNSAWENWDTRKISLEVSIGLFVDDESSESWRVLAHNVDEFIQCANVHTPSEADVCNSKNNAVRVDLQNFLSAVRASRIESSIITSEEVRQIRSALSVVAE